MFFLANGDVREVASGLSVRDDMLIRESDGRLLVWSHPGIVPTTVATPDAGGSGGR